MQLIYLFTVFALFITLISSFQTCERYVANTYLYLLTSLLFIFSFIKYFETNSDADTKVGNVYTNYILIFALCYIALFILILFTPSNYLIAKHLLWLVFIFMSAILMYNLIKGKDDEVVRSTLLLTTILFGAASVIAVIYKDSLEDKRFTGLMIGVFIGLAVLSAFIQKGTPLSKAITIAILAILCYSVVIDTKDLLIKQHNCVIPDYIDESAGFFVTIQNIFSRLITLQSD